MIKMFTETPELLLPRQYVKFIGEGRDFTDNVKDGDMFRVTKTQQVLYEQAFILPPSNTTMLDLSSETATSLGLYPTSVETLYEILVGIKGGKDIIVYPQIPAGKFFARLEKAELTPVPQVPQLRYLGFVDVKATPIDKPKLRIHTIKDLEPLIFVLYNDGSDYEKIVFRFLVNKCKIKKLEPEEAKKVEIYREIHHFEALRW